MIYVFVDEGLINEVMSDGKKYPAYRVIDFDCFEGNECPVCRNEIEPRDFKTEETRTVNTTITVAIKEIVDGKLVEHTSTTEVSPEISTLTWGAHKYCPTCDFDWDSEYDYSEVIKLVKKNDKKIEEEPG